MRVLLASLLMLIMASPTVAQEKPPNKGIVGIQISADGDSWSVIGVVPNSPAAGAGIQSGDAILAVDGVNTKHFQQLQLVGAISGEPGTQVVLTIQRDGSAKRIHLVLTRAPLEDYLPQEQ